MPSSQWPGTCLDLISHVRVMTLATAKESRPWSAPVYYLFTDKKFYFFSSPDSRHIRDGNNQACSASIFRTHDMVENLEGLQMGGHILEPGSKRQAAAAALAYARQFGISVSGTDIPGFFETVFHARLYMFEPDLVCYMDNRKGFGSRERMVL
jgi:uncharacterized protein